MVDSWGEGSLDSFGPYTLLEGYLSDIYFGEGVSEEEESHRDESPEDSSEDEDGFGSSFHFK